MVKYTFTEEDLEKLYNVLGNDESFWWVEGRIEEWKDTLTKSRDNQPIMVDEIPWLIEERVKRFALLQLDKDEISNNDKI